MSAIRPETDLNTPPAGKPRPELIANATFLTFEPGLYAVEFRSGVNGLSEAGLPMPGARIEPLTLPGSIGRALVVTTPEGGWMSTRMQSAHVLVTGGNATVLLTIYRLADGTPMPEVHFSFVLPAPPAPGDAAFSREPTATLPGADRPSVWVGDESGAQSLGGFSIAAPAGVLSSEFEYQGIMGLDWRTPWVESGVFCGSRTNQLPLLGFRLRLRGAAAERFICRAWGRFAGAGEIGPIDAGEDCYGDGAVLLAMKVEIEPRFSA